MYYHSISYTGITFDRYIRCDTYLLQSEQKRSEQWNDVKRQREKEKRRKIEWNEILNKGNQQKHGLISMFQAFSPLIHMYITVCMHYDCNIDNSIY